MTSPTVVLGWDGLDYQLLTEFGLRDAFGEQVTRIETFDNHVAGEPLTRELWPSIITGEHPETHGIYAETEDDGIEWNNPVIDIASRMSAGVVPKTVRVQIGRMLRNQGARVNQKHAAYLEDQPAGTVFTERDSVALSIPSYQTALDRRLGLVVDRTAIWDDILHTVDTPEGTRYEPDVSVAELDMRLLGKAKRRLGYVEAAASQQPDIVFCWFGYIDTVGHLEPSITTSSWQREHYQRAARWTQSLRDALDADVVCVSDHGLRDGHHTHDAVYAAPDGAPLPESVLDVRDTVSDITSTGGGRMDDGWGGALGETKDQLEALGYV